MIVVGDALRLPWADGSVHCVVTSPPYYGLRDYGTAKWEGGDPSCDHKADRSNGVASSTLEGGKLTTNHQQEGYKAVCGKCGARRVDSQLGLESTPEQYVARMVEVFREVRRVLRDDGTVWLNIGDSYAGSMKGMGADGTAYGGPKQRTNNGSIGIGRPDWSQSGLKPKDLIGIPWRLAFALQADGWWLRSEIIWAKPNPMPESVTDRPTKAHEQVFLLSKRATYYYDAEAIKEQAIHEGRVVKATGSDAKNGQKGEWGRTAEGFTDHDTTVTNRNKRSVWTVATQPFPEAHFATMPEKLVEPCVLAGTSAMGVCPRCGAGWERVVEKGDLVKDDGTEAKLVKPVKRDGSLSAWSRPGGKVETVVPNSHYERTTTGWRPGCECDAGEPVPAVVLDPFAGAGTVGVVAKRLGRRFVGVELNPEYVKMAERRIGRVQPPLFV